MCAEYRFDLGLWIWGMGFILCGWRSYQQFRNQTKTKPKRGLSPTHSSYSTYICTQALQFHLLPPTGLHCYYGFKISEFHLSITCALLCSWHPCWSVGPTRWRSPYPQLRSLHQDLSGWSLGPVDKGRKEPLVFLTVIVTEALSFLRLPVLLTEEWLTSPPITGSCTQREEPVTGPFPVGHVEAFFCSFTCDEKYCEILCANHVKIICKKSCFFITHQSWNTVICRSSQKSRLAGKVILLVCLQYIKLTFVLRAGTWT